MKNRVITLLLALAIVVSLFAGLTLTATAAEPTNAGEVHYVTSGKYVYNWGKRDSVAKFLTTYAMEYYTGAYSFTTLAAKSGDSGTGTNFYSSPLGTAIHSMLVSKQSYSTSYAGTKDLFKYTDCQEGGGKISSYYSGVGIGPEWDGNWNREHTWPNSKGLDGADENDIMMLRPTAISENGDRGNDAYGKSSSYYDPNQNGQSLRGDVARLMLQQLMRWGNTSKFYGTGGVMENRAVLLEWMAEDPVDTWEMGRNDAVQQITGVRNVFVDYPELAFQLLGAPVPTGYPTPSGGSAPEYKITAISNNTAYGTVSLSGSVITATPKEGYAVIGYAVTEGTAEVTRNGDSFVVLPSSDCTVCINFAPKTAATINFSVPAGVSCSAASGYLGEAISLPKPTGTPTGEYDYTFKGWVEAPVTDSETKPAVIYTDSYTPSAASTTLYALYIYSAGGGSGTGDYIKVLDSDDLTDGRYLIVYEIKNVALNSALDPLDAVANTIPVTISNRVIPSNETTDAAAFTFTASEGSFLGENGLYICHTSSKNTLDTDSAVQSNTVSIDSNGNAVIQSGTYSLRFNDQSGQDRFRYYASGQKDIQLYKQDGEGGTTYYTTVIGEIEPCEHDYAAVVTAPTCTEDGYTTYTCSKCGDSYTADKVEALGHAYVTETIAPTETEQGYDLHTCSRCGDEYMDNYTDPIGPTPCEHTNTELRDAKEPTCTEPGYTGDLFCSDCDELLEQGEMIAALGHDFADGFCTRCGEEDPNQPPVPVDPCEGYTDIDRNAWYHPYADFVIENALMGSTTPDGLTFEPTTACTRGMIVTILYSLAGKPEVEFEAKFPDVKDDQWYTDPVMWAYQNGVVSGYDNGNFGPADKVTREQMAVVLKAYTEKIVGADTSKTADLGGFADAAKVTWSKPYISWAVAEGLLSGKPVGDKVNLDPQGNASRAEVAAILMSYITNILEK